MRISQPEETGQRSKRPEQRLYAAHREAALHHFGNAAKAGAAAKARSSHTKAWRHTAAGLHTAAADHHGVAAARIERMLKGPRPAGGSRPAGDSRPADDPATAFVLDMIADPLLTNTYIQALRAAVSNGQPQQLEDFLHRSGYDTDPTAIAAAFAALRRSRLDLWAGRYDTVALYEGDRYTQAPVLTIDGNGIVSLGDDVLVQVEFHEQTLSWSMDRGNATNGRIVFGVISDGAGMSVGNAFSGQLRTSSSRSVGNYTGATKPVAHDERVSFPGSATRGEER